MSVVTYISDSHWIPPKARKVPKETHAAQQLPASFDHRVGTRETARTPRSRTTRAATGIARSARARRRKTWLAAREADLLPVPYYHVVFTLPAAVADIAYQNKAFIYDLLFKASAETPITIAADPRHLGARAGRRHLAVAIGRPDSSPPRSLPKQAFNAPRQQTASAEIPIASDARPHQTCRGFLPRRFAYAGPGVRRATFMGAGVRKPSQKWSVASTFLGGPGCSVGIKTVAPSSMSSV